MPVAKQAMDDRQVDQVAPSARFARVARYLLTRDDEVNCHPQPNVDVCEKPAISSHVTEIVIGLLAFLLVGGTTCVLIFLHLRRKKRDEREWPKNNSELEDYGIEAPGAASVNKPKDTYQQARAAVAPSPPRPAPAPASPPKRASRNSLDTLAQSLRGPKEPYKATVEDDEITPDMKPVEPSSRV